MSPRRKSVERRAEVVPLAPMLLRVRDAAAYLGVSVSLLNSRRLEDGKALAAGQSPTGPAWVVLEGKSVFYRREALDAWVQASAVERGVVAFRGAP